MANLEMSPWHSRLDRDHGESETPECSLSKPDYIVFDLDPYVYSGAEKPGLEPEPNPEGFRLACDAAVWLRDMLTKLGLCAFVKSTGKTGLHVFSPIVPDLDYRDIRRICETIGQHLMAAHPESITMEWKTQRRTGKVFFDHNMNARAKSLAAAHSPRAHSSAGVSVPLAWENLKSFDPMDFNVLNAAEKVLSVPDPWAEFEESRADLRGLFEEVESIAA